MSGFGSNTSQFQSESAGLPRRRAVAVYPQCQEVVLILGYVCLSITVLAGLIDEDSPLRIAASPLASICLVALLIMWHFRIGWLSVPLGAFMVAGILLLALGDLIILEQQQTGLHMLGFLLLVAGDACLATSLWLPTVNIEALYEHGVDLTEGAPAHAAARVPLQPWLAVPYAVAGLAALLTWRLAFWQGSAGTPASNIGGGVTTGGGDIDGFTPTDTLRFPPMAAMVVAQAVLVWRAAARVGYRSPTPAMALLAVDPAGGTGVDAPASGKGKGTGTGRGSSGGAAGTQDSGSSATPRKALGRGSTTSQQPSQGTTEGFDPSPSLRTPSGRPVAYGATDVDAAPTPPSGGPQGGQGTQEGKGGPVQVRSNRAEALRRGTGDALLEMYGRSETLEGRGTQIVGLVGVLLLCAAHLLACGALLFGWGVSGELQLEGPPSTVLVLYALCNWMAQLLIVFSVPLVLPPRGTLDDQYVRPRRYDGPPLRVLVLLPQRFDAGEIAVPWFLLRSRGHLVEFTTTSGRAPPVPDPASVRGAGVAGVGGAGPLVAAMLSRLLEDPSYRKPLPVRLAKPDAYDGLLVAGVGPVPSKAGSAWLRDGRVQAAAAAFWDTGRPVGALGRGVALLGRAREGQGDDRQQQRAVAPWQRQAPGPAVVPDVGPSLLEGSVVTTAPWQLERLAATADVCCACRCNALPRACLAACGGTGGTQCQEASVGYTARCCAGACSGLRLCALGCRGCCRYGRDACESCGCPGCDEQKGGGCTVCLGRSSTAAGRPGQGLLASAGASWQDEDCCAGVGCWEDPEPRGSASHGSALALHEVDSELCLASSEIEGAVGGEGRYLRGPWTMLSRGSPWDDSLAFVVEDGRLVTGRWAGDAFLLGRRFLHKIEEVPRMY